MSRARRNKQKARASKPARAGHVTERCRVTWKNGLASIVSALEVERKRDYYEANAVRIVDADTGTVLYEAPEPEAAD